MKIQQLEIEEALHDQTTLDLKKNMKEAYENGLALSVTAEEGEDIANLRRTIRHVARMLKLKGVRTYSGGDKVVVELPKTQYSAKK